VQLVVFTRDLRVADHPALAAAARRGSVVCAFVLDDAIRRSRPDNPLRTAFLRQCLVDLDTSLHRLGSRLVVRQGDWVSEVLALAVDSGARTVHLSDDITPYARSRLARLEAQSGRCVQIRRHPGLTVVPPGSLAPAGGDHYHVFTPYYRRWAAAPRRPSVAAPRSLPPPSGEPDGRAPLSTRAPRARSSAGLGAGGERAAHARLQGWLEGGLATYGRRRDALDASATSKLSPYLHFGCLSPLQVEDAVAQRPGSEAYLRQLCWRDFYMQVLAARPGAAWADYVDRGPPRRQDPTQFDSWRDGRTGFPLVDAAMRQLASEGWMPNRARMVAASLLTKQLGLDWRAGARHFLEKLIDADLAVNNLNWQWTAGRGTGSNPCRVLNPTRQGRLFDPEGAYVRRFVPELRCLPARDVHDPSPGQRAGTGYPPPLLGRDG
jgi:deoxyribodipyrimidine photo-lyase